MYTNTIQDESKQIKEAVERAVAEQNAEIFVPWMHFDPRMPFGDVKSQVIRTLPEHVFLTASIPTDLGMEPGMTGSFHLIALLNQSLGQHFTH